MSEAANIRKTTHTFNTKTAFYRMQLNITSAIGKSMGGESMTHMEIELLAHLLAAPNPTGDAFSAFNKKQVRDKMKMKPQSMSTYLKELNRKGYITKLGKSYILAEYLKLQFDSDLIFQLRLVKPHDKDSKNQNSTEFYQQRTSQELLRTVAKGDANEVQPNGSGRVDNTLFQRNEANDGGLHSHKLSNSVSGKLLSEWAEG